ncbi:hypothetical protein RJ640_027532 [Escallonia rubra]|uniref:Retrotransposon gag domain-containing protein n=1 Tax=Escallonia rubra TaxID=112253 RepID=A0AA88U9X6_9ASTE|nr:hypothetical protein RJ640_027532 [Escallonia rubra]
MPPRRVSRNINDPYKPPRNDGVAEAIVQGFQSLANLITGDFPQNVKDQKEEEFLKLVQNDMTVAQYEAKFTSLLRHAPYLIDIENHKARRFEKGIKCGIKNRLLAMKLSTYAKVVERAKILETDYGEFLK